MYYLSSTQVVDIYRNIEVSGSKGNSELGINVVPIRGLSQCFARYIFISVYLGR